MPVNSEEEEKEEEVETVSDSILVTIQQDSSPLYGISHSSSSSSSSTSSTSSSFSSPLPQEDAQPTKKTRGSTRITVAQVAATRRSK